MELFPGLPHDMAMECLTRLPLDSFPSATSVSKSWKSEIENPTFLNLRRTAGTFQSIFVFSQAWGTSKLAGSHFYRLVAFCPESKKWSELPPVPDYPNGLPILCHLAGVGSELVVIGGCDPKEWQVFDSVFVYSFLTNTWRRGSRMPGGQRFLFGCASDSVRVVYVAGGHDEDKKALKSVLAYDVAEDKWTRLPDMVKARDECKGIYHDGKFHVIGGYPTERQGRFGRDAEAFDVATWQWGPVESAFLEESTCPRTCAALDDGHVYKCSEGRVIVREGATWRAVIGLPDGICQVDVVTAWQGKLVVIGYSGFGRPHKTYILDLKDCKWEQVDAQDDYSGHVQSGCNIQI